MNEQMHVLLALFALFIQDPTQAASVLDTLNRLMEFMLLVWSVQDHIQRN